ncbi:MAG TPA: hypothetical protein VL979_04370 [Solirubrobacteraceae bacterium]|nr:hypothetical protein [Solirubrobacteraceae bacterium]
MYHVELREFPHNVCRFNLSAPELQAIVGPWLRGVPFEYREHEWVPPKAKLTIVEGPRLDPGQMTMGRGWSVAQREGEDVTEAVLTAAGESARAGSAPAGAGAAVPPAPAGALGAASPIAAAPSPALGDAFTLGVQIAALLGPDPLRLLHAWREAATQAPGLGPSETLARAEAAVRAAGGEE